MTQLDWNSAGNRFYETGVDRGVLYLYGAAYPWPGLTSVDETPSGGAAKPLYYDGVKYSNRSAAEEFEATISAYASPPEFDVCDGAAGHNGLFATQQPRVPFSMSYRTKVGSDATEPADSYKIHLIYNALVAPASKTYASVSNTPNAVPLKWKITTLPPGLTGIKPTSHYFIDSRYTDPAVLTQLETVLYGSDIADAALPSVSDLFAMFGETVMDAQFPDTPTTQFLDGGTP